MLWSLIITSYGTPVLIGYFKTCVMLWPSVIPIMATSAHKIYIISLFETT